MSQPTPTNHDANVQPLIDQFIAELVSQLHYSPEEAAQIAEVARPIYIDLLPHPASEGNYGRDTHPPAPNP